MTTVSNTAAGHGDPELTLASCAYCGLQSGQAVVKCGICRRHFCNDAGTLTASHIVLHMIHSRHNCVVLQPSSPLGGETLECYKCEARNVFSLGFVAAKKDLMVVILCRLPCAQQRNIEWATDDWQPLVADRALLPWVAPFPTPEETTTARLVLADDVQRVEALWRRNCDVSLEEMSKATARPPLFPVLLRSKDCAIYHNLYVPLIDAESAADKAATESQTWEVSYMQWATDERNTHVAEFVLAPYESKGVHTYKGDRVTIHYRDIRASEADDWKGCGTLVHVPSPHNDKYVVRLNENQPPPPPASVGFAIEFMWLGVTHERMLKAVRKFALAHTSTSAFVYHTILGHEVKPVEFTTPLPASLSFPALAGLRPLNASQEAAVSAAIRKPLVLIQGPPGTGKSVTASAIVYHLSKSVESSILVCAPLNVAVDHITNKLHDLGLQVVRVYSQALEQESEAAMSDFSLYTQAKKLLLQKLQSRLARQKEGAHLPPEQANKLKTQLWKTASKVLKLAQIVCCTCVGAQDFRLLKKTFRTVLIDESTQACEPEVMIPITKGAKQVILIGDHQQLGPVILDKDARKAGLSQSLYERMIALGHIPYRLQVQYRMHPALSEFPSNVFYEGSLQNGVVAMDREWPRLTFPWPVPSFPMMFWANYGKEELGSTGHSYLNRVEAMNVEKVINRLYMDGVKPSQIGVITPYQGQRAYLTTLIKNSRAADQAEPYDEIEIASVDAFQGREKDFIILSCVRANDQGFIGFLSDMRRLNVAITRARYGLLILGNPRLLSRNKLWRSLLVHYRERGCLVEGPLESLQLSTVLLNEKPDRTTEVRSLGFAAAYDTQSMASYIPDFSPAGAETPNYNYDDQLWPKLSGSRAEADDTDGNTRAPAELTTALEKPSDEFASVFSSALNI